MRSPFSLDLYKVQVNQSKDTSYTLAQRPEIIERLLYTGERKPLSEVDSAFLSFSGDSGVSHGWVSL